MYWIYVENNRGCYKIYYYQSKHFPSAAAEIICTGPDIQDDFISIPIEKDDLLEILLTQIKSRREEPAERQRNRKRMSQKISE